MKVAVDVLITVELEMEEVNHSFVDAAVDAWVQDQDVPVRGYHAVEWSILP